MSDNCTAVEDNAAFSWERSTRLDDELRRYSDALDARRPTLDAEALDPSPTETE